MANRKSEPLSHTGHSLDDRARRSGLRTRSVNIAAGPVGQTADLRTKLPLQQFDLSWSNISALRPSSANPKTHPPKQISQIAASIQSFGFTNPVIVDDSGRILAGHGRVEAARLLGLKAVPTEGSVPGAMQARLA